MNLVDTSVWIEFFRGSPRAEALGPLMEEDLVLLHPWVYGELLLGGLGSRQEAVLRDLGRLARVSVIPDNEVLHLIEARRLSGRGIGWVDTQLLASALVARVRLWTLDRRLAALAAELEVEGLWMQ